MICCSTPTPFFLTRGLAPTLLGPTLFRGPFAMFYIAFVPAFTRFFAEIIFIGSLELCRLAAAVPAAKSLLQLCFELLLDSPICVSRIRATPPLHETFLTCNAMLSRNFPTGLLGAS